MIIPKSVLHTDTSFHQLLQEVSFSQYLNPTNSNRAKQLFLSGTGVPPFIYKPLTQADSLLKRLDQLICKEEHTAAELLNEKIRRVQTFIVALRDRTEKAFDALNTIEHWYPCADLMNIEIPEEHTSYEAAQLSAETLIEYLHKALKQRKMKEWRIVKDVIMSARILVDGSKCVIRIKPSAQFRKTDLIRLVVHEIDVHAVRSQNGHKQMLKCFATGLPNSMQTEEGLAMVAERKRGVHIRGTLKQQKWVIWGILKGKKLGFRELYKALCEHCHADLAWGICQRIKRGLSHPDLPGVYAKDSVYLSGWYSVNNWLSQGGNIHDLYVGKVSIHDPVQEWIEEGWVHPQPVPSFWTQ